jgi:hypothetical protein
MKTWDDIVAALELPGAANQTIKKSILIGWETKTHIQLLLANEYRVLATPVVADKIAAAIEKVLGHKITVEIQVQKEIPIVIPFKPKKLNGAN